MLIVDLGSDTLGDPESDGVLALCTEGSLKELTGFGLVKGRSLWPSAEGVRRLVVLYRKLASPAHLPHSRSTPYMTTDEEYPDLSGLPTRSAPSAAQATLATGVADTRLEALETQVRAGGLSDGPAVGPAEHRAGNLRNRRLRATAFRGGGRACRIFLEQLCLERRAAPRKGCTTAARQRCLERAARATCRCRTGR